MDELFRQIIIGEKDLKELDNNHSNMSKKVQNTNEVAKYFLKVSKRKFNDEKIKKKDIKKLLEVYSDLIKENKTIKKFINSKEDNGELLNDAERIIKLFIDDYVKEKENVSIWKKEIQISGFVEPLLLSVITVLMSIIFLGNLYLMM